MVRFITNIKKSIRLRYLCGRGYHGQAAKEERGFAFAYGKCPHCGDNYSRVMSRKEADSLSDDESLSRMLNVLFGAD